MPKLHGSPGNDKSLVIILQIDKFVEKQSMALNTDDLGDPNRFRLLKSLSYSDLASFVMENIMLRTPVMIAFWSACLIFLGLALTIIFNNGAYFSVGAVILHSFMGLIVFPVIIVPVHEILHIIPYSLSGARNIRFGFEPDQFLFYVTAHRYVATPSQFKAVAIIPFFIISIATILSILILPGLWKWSLSLFLFVHATMCAGDFAMLNFYYLNRDKKIYTWDDADLKEAYFYEEL